MVNVDMFKGAFPTKQQPIEPEVLSPRPRTRTVLTQEDPEIAKLRRWVLYALVAIVGGGAVIAIAWRVILKIIG